MRNLNKIDLSKVSGCRLPNSIETPAGIVHYDLALMLDSPINEQPMVVLASTGHSWDHVSISLQNRTPNWSEMEYVKRLLFREHETAMQLHVPVKDHINVHPYVLHLWRPQRKKIPMPPSILV